MARRRSSASVAVIVLMLGLVGLGVVAVSWWPVVSAPGGAAARSRTTTATVVESTPCGAEAPRDVVEIEVEGRRVRVPYDGCGHREGQRLRVRIPAEPSGEFLARPASAADGEADASSGERLSRVLLVLAGAAGSGYALMLGGADPRARRDSRDRVYDTRGEHEGAPC